MAMRSHWTARRWWRRSPTTSLSSPRDCRRPRRFPMVSWSRGSSTDRSARSSRARGTSASSFVGGSDLAVFENTDNRDAAWKFIAWLSQPEVQVRWYELVNDLPAVVSAWDDPALASDPLVATFGEQLQDAKSTPAIPTWEQVAAAIEGEL